MASLREERDKMKATLSGTGFKVRIEHTGSVSKSNLKPAVADEMYVLKQTATDLFVIRC